MALWLLGNSLVYPVKPGASKVVIHQAGRLTRSRRGGQVQGELKTEVLDVEAGQGPGTWEGINQQEDQQKPDQQDHEG